jgi:hypothetical protein
MLTSGPTADTTPPRRLRTTGFLKSIGMERTTAVLLVGVVVLLFAFFSIIGSDIPTSMESKPELATTSQSAEVASEPVEIDILPQQATE